MSHLVAGRAQMGTSLAFHLSFAVFGVGLPAMMLAAEGMYLRGGDAVWLALARRWAKAIAVLIAVGAVSGTIVSFELGRLWPGFTQVAGRIIGLPFSLTGLRLVARGRDELRRGRAARGRRTECVDAIAEPPGAAAQRGISPIT